MTIHESSKGTDPPIFTVTIADDDDVLRDTLVALVNADPQLDVVGETADAASAIALAASLQPDVAVLDMKMPYGGGLRAAKEIADRSPRTKVLGLSVFADHATVRDLLRVGAIGYLVKGQSAASVVEAIHGAAHGESVLAPRVTADVISGFVDALDRAEQLAEDLARLDGTKRELVEILAHELFTPVTVIQGVVELMAMGMASDEIDGLKTSSRRAGARLERIVRNIRTVMRLDVDATVAETVAVSALLERAVDAFDADAGRFVLPASDLETMIWTNPDDAVTAIDVLLENAFAFSPEGEQVTITLTRTADDVTVEVADRGPGIAPELSEKIFDLFAIGQPVDTRSHGGVGVGLHMAKRIVEAHGGRIAYHPTPGGGATFSLTFQAAKVTVANAG